MGFLSRLFRKTKPAKAVRAPGYDLDTLEGIQVIAIPPGKQFSAPLTKSIEYILQRKATEHKRNGRMDLAIACLRKSNELLPHSNFTWPASDYLRLVKYLMLDGQLGEAIKVMESLKPTFKTDTDRMRYFHVAVDVYSRQGMRFEAVTSACLGYLYRAQNERRLLRHAATEEERESIINLISNSETPFAPAEENIFAISEKGRQSLDSYLKTTRMIEENDVAQFVELTLTRDVE